MIFYWYLQRKGIIFVLIYSETLLKCLFCLSALWESLSTESYNLQMEIIYKPMFTHICLVLLKWKCCKLRRKLSADWMHSIQSKRKKNSGCTLGKKIISKIYKQSQNLNFRKKFIASPKKRYWNEYSSLKKKLKWSKSCCKWFSILILQRNADKTILKFCLIQVRVAIIIKKE